MKKAILVRDGIDDYSGDCDDGDQGDGDAHHVDERLNKTCKQANSSQIGQGHLTKKVFCKSRTQ